MPQPQKTRWHAIPKHHIVDAAPVAGICILLCVPGFFPIAYSLLHVWLWLRHPRSRSRYLFAAIPIGFVFLIVGVIVFISYMDALAYGAPIFDRTVLDLIAKFSGSIAAGGIIPILYRLFSRSSLAYSDESSVGGNKAPSRGSIADVLFLSGFCAITMVAIQSLKVETYGLFSFGSEPRDLVALAIAGSIAGIASMRIIAESKGRAALGRFAIAVIVSGLLIYGVLEATRFVRLSVTDSPFEFSWQNGYYWETDLVTLCVFAALIPIFAVIMRYCGVTLRRSAMSSGEIESRNAESSKAASRFSQHALQATGALFVGAIAGFVCLAPGDVAAGIPLKYFERLEVETDVFETVSFSWVALAIDTAVCLLLTLAVVAPVSWRSGVKIRRVRICALAVFALLVIHVCYVRPFRHSGFEKQDGIREVRRDEASGSALISVINRVEEFFGLDKLIPRGHISGVYFQGADDDLIRRMLALPRLQSVAFEDCVVSNTAANDLAGSRYMTRVALRNCQVHSKAVEIIRTLPRLKNFHVDLSTQASFDIATFESTSLVNMVIETVDGRQIQIPHGVGSVIVFVPTAHDRNIQVLGDDDLNEVRILGIDGYNPIF